MCNACEADLPHLPDLVCPQCAAVSPEGQRCGRCLSDPPHFDATLAAFRYQFPFDKLMQAYKFRAQLALADEFAAALATRFQTTEITFDTLVPLPISRARLASRGFDQTALIAQSLSQRLPNIKLTRQLIKVRDTPPQSGLDREARLKNVRGAFECATGLSGRHVAILDDVMTTGATLSEAARTLKKAGAARVTAMAVARADHGRMDGGAIPF
ncbi:MAG: ComF family protein [Betaproteobacteria bacterium]|nr:ComF family protein [Betaproteobacteria bacterium]